MRAISTFSLEAGTSTFWCRACSALRTLVSISATGSVNLIVCFSSRHPFAPLSTENLRQLVLLRHPQRDASCLAKDLGAPRDHSRALCENSRVRRASLPGRLRDSRNLPAQRQLPEAQPAQSELAQIRARPSANLATVVPARGELVPLLFLVARQLKLLFDLRVLNPFRCSHAILNECLSSNSEPLKPRMKTLLCPERHPQMLQQRARLVVVRRSGHNRHVHPLHLVDFLVRNLREDQLIVQSNRIVAPSVERLGGDSPEISNPRQHDIHQSVEKFIHAVAPQRNHGSNRLPFAHLEGRNRL